MKNNMKKLRLALFSALACLFLQSCNDFLDVDPKHAASEIGRASCRERV